MVLLSVNGSGFGRGTTSLVFCSLEICLFQGQSDLSLIVDAIKLSAVFVLSNLQLFVFKRRETNGLLEQCTSPAQRKVHSRNSYHIRSVLSIASKLFLIENPVH